MSSTYSRSVENENSARMAAAMLVSKGIAFEFTKREKEFGFLVELRYQKTLNIVLDACLPTPSYESGTFPNRSD